MRLLMTSFAILLCAAAPASSQGTATNTAKEEATMRAANERFRREHPPQQDSYKDTKQYKAQSSGDQTKTDAMVKATQKGVANIKAQDAAAKRSCPPGKICAGSAY